jgi:hypothetical protein
MTIFVFTSGNRLKNQHEIARRRFWAEARRDDQASPSVGCAGRATKRPIKISLGWLMLTFLSDCK